MRNDFYPLTDITGVGTGQRATIVVPAGARYHQILLFATGTVGGVAQTAAQLITNVRLIVNGVVIRDLTGPQYQMICDGFAPQLPLNTDTGCMRIFFSEPARASVMSEQISAWPIPNGATFRIEVDILAGVAALTFRAMAVYDYFFPRDEKGNLIMRITSYKRFSLNAPASTFDIDNIEKTYPISRLHFIPPAGSVISQAEVRMDQVSIFRALAQDNTNFIGSYGHVVPTVGGLTVFPILFDYNNQGDGAIAPNATLNVNLTNSVAGTMTVVQEQIKPGYL